MAVTYQRTRHPTDHDLNKFDDRVNDLVIQINQQLAAEAKTRAAATSAAVLVPIGSIVFVDISLTGVPAPGPNFQKCDGSAITDLRSPMHGQNTRDLITAGRFVRAAATSGTLQAQDTLLLAHVHDLNAHTHGPGSYVVGVKNTPNSATGATGSGVNILGANTATFSVTGTSAGAVGNTLGPNPTGTETRPVNISMVPYVRIW